MTPSEERQLDAKSWAGIAKDEWRGGLAVGVFIGFWIGAILGPMLFRS